MTTGIDGLVRGRPGAPAARRRWLGPVLAGVVLVLVGLLAVQPSATGDAFDPASTGPTGLRALVDTLRALGVDVEVTDDPATVTDADSVLVPPLGWPRELVDQLASGGARVVAQVPPTEESVANPLGLGGIGLVDLRPSCSLLADVRSLRTSQWSGWQPDVGTPVAERCLTAGSAAWLHRLAVGRGELVSLATMAPLTNQRFRDSDAGLAAVRLLAPSGEERVAVLLRPPGEPPPTLVDLLDPRWFDAAWLTLGVLLLLALARGRRLGRPVDEELPIRVPSGELARAIGDLRHRAGHEARSAAELRARTLAACRRRLGLPSTTPAPVVIDELRARGVTVPPGVVAAVTGPLPEDAGGLVRTARALAELRHALTGAATGAATTPDDRTAP